MVDRMMLFRSTILAFLLIVSATSFCPSSDIPRHTYKVSAALTRVDATPTTNSKDNGHINHKTWMNLPKPMNAFKMLAAGSVLAGSILLSHPLPAVAQGSRMVGQLKGSGLVFKDTLEVEAFDDPKIKGITLYISNFNRPLTERLSAKNFLSDPSYASVACVRTGPVVVADTIAKGTAGEEVFEEKTSLLFKTLRVQRIYDEDKKTAVYVSYNTRIDKGDDTNKSRFKSSLCAVSLE